MSARRGRLFLIGVALTMLIAAAVFQLRRPEIGSPPLPSTSPALAARVARHPADWEAATVLAEVALDARNENRLQLWHAAYGHASALAPGLPGPPNSFARAAFFHWAELSPKDQQEALAAYAPLLQDPLTFTRMAEPLFELTGDLSMLERAQPHTQYSTGVLIDLALPNGRFDDYRKLREELQQLRTVDFNARVHIASPGELIAHFPDPPYSSDSEPLIVKLLEEFHQRPLDEMPARPAVIDGVVDYALRHGLEPLDGLEIVTRKTGAASDQTRIRLARKLGLVNIARQIELGANDPRRPKVVDSEWQGLCGNDICNRGWRSIEAGHAVSLTIETAQSDDVAAYVEIYVDDALRAEGEVGARRDFIVPVGNPGTHRVEVVLANPRTRNGAGRRLHVASITTL
jgi:hypothetical protein